MVWISKKKWKEMEQRVANLEEIIQNWQIFDPVESKKLLKDSLQRFQREATRDTVLKSS